NGTPVRVVVAEASPVGYRGERIRVAGEVNTASGGAPGVSVDVYLAPAGHHGDDAHLMGRTVTDEGGFYVLDLDLPADPALGPYEVSAASDSTDELAPGLSQ